MAAPIFLLSPNEVLYTENGGFAILDTSAYIEDADPLTYNNAIVTVSFTSGNTADDVLYIQNDQALSNLAEANTVGAGINFPGANQISYNFGFPTGPKTVATFTGGTNGDPLVITFNANLNANFTATITPDIVMSVIRNIMYGNIADDPTPGDRTLQFEVNDGNAGITQATKTVSFTTVNDAPVISVPNTTFTLYDGTGTPNSQGFVYQALPNQPVNVVQDEGTLNTEAIDTALLPTVPPVNDYAGFFGKPELLPILDREAGYSIHFDLKIIAEDHSSASAQKNGDGIADRAGFSITVLSNDRVGIELGFWTDTIWAQEDGAAEPSPGNPTGTLFTHAEEAAFNTTVTTAYELYIQGNTYSLFANGNSTPVLTGDLRDYSAFVTPDFLPSNPYQTPNFVFFGDNTPTSTAHFTLGEISITTAPELANPTVDEDTALVIEGVRISDVDAGSNPITVTLAVEDGQLTVDPGVVGGVTQISNNGTGTVTLTGTIDQINTTLADATGLTYQGLLNFNGADTLTITANDGGFSGGAAKISQRTLSLTVNSVNDAPFIDDEVLGAIAEDTPNPTGATIATLFGAGFSDADSNSSFAGLAIVGNTANAGTEGSWQYSTNTGTNWFDIGTVTDGATALALSSTTRLRFVPVAEYNGTPPALTVRALDNTYAGSFTAGNTRVTVNTTTNGDSTPIADETNTLSTSVTAIAEVTNVSSPNANGIYGDGDPISITITFDEIVNVTGTPELLLETGASDGIAVYSSGSGTNTLTFTYTFNADDINGDLDYTSPSALILNGGTINNSAGTPADLTLPAPGSPGSLGANKNFDVSPAGPVVTDLISNLSAIADADVGAGNFTLTLLYSEAMDTGIDPLLEFPTVGENPGNALAFASGEWTNATTYVATFNVADTNITLPDLDIKISGAESAASELQIPSTVTDVISIDTANPTLTLSSTAANTVTAPFNVTATFSEAVTGFSLGDVLVGNGTASNLAGSGTTYTFTITPNVAGGVTVNVNGNIAEDSFGNGNVGATAPLTRTFVTDLTAPTAAIAPVSPDIRTTSVDSLTIQFSEAVTQFDLADLTLTRNGSPVSLAGANLTSTDNITWTLGNLAGVTAEDGAYDLTVAPNGVTDLAGNVLATATRETWLTGQTATPFPAIAFSGGKRGERRKGTKEGDKLRGTAGNDVMKGGDGNDRLTSGKQKQGGDRLFGGNGNDRINAGKGNDRLDGGNGNDRMNGKAGNDELRGGDGVDLLIGGEGNDVLGGGLGNDTLTGGGGGDAFTFNALNEGIDTITDFQIGVDLIDLRPIFAQSPWAGSSGFAQFTQFVQVAQVGANTEVRIDADGSGAGTTFTPLITLSNVAANTVTSRQFVIA